MTVAELNHKNAGRLALGRRNFPNHRDHDEECDSTRPSGCARIHVRIDRTSYDAKLMMSPLTDMKNTHRTLPYIMSLFARIYFKDR